MGHVELPPWDHVFGDGVARGAGGAERVKARGGHLVGGQLGEIGPLPWGHGGVGGGGDDEQ